MDREFKIFNAGNGESEILVYGTIGDDWDGVTAKTFARQIKNLGDVGSIKVRINSPGGSAIDGLAMSSILAAHPAKVAVEIEGWALSAATIVAMGGDSIAMWENSQFMVHNASMVAWGQADDMRKAAEILDRTDAQVVTTYAKRTGLEPEKLRDLMASETWFDAAGAVEAGFATVIIPAKGQPTAGGLAPDRMKFRNMPAEVAALLVASADRVIVTPDPALAARLQERKKVLDKVLANPVV